MLSQIIFRTAILNLRFFFISGLQQALLVKNENDHIRTEAVMLEFLDCEANGNVSEGFQTGGQFRKEIEYLKKINSNHEYTIEMQKQTIWGRENATQGLQNELENVKARMKNIENEQSRLENLKFTISALNESMEKQSHVQSNVTSLYESIKRMDLESMSQSTSELKKKLEAQQNSIETLTGLFNILIGSMKPVNETGRYHEISPRILNDSNTVQVLHPRFVNESTTAYILTSDMKRVTRTLTPGWKEALIDEPLQLTGKYAYSIRLINVGESRNVMVGVASLPIYRISGFPRGYPETMHGWMFNLNDNYVYKFRYGYVTQDYVSTSRRAFADGDIIDVQIDMDKRTLYLEVNGEPYGSVYISFDGNAKPDLRAAVDLNGDYFYSLEYL